MFYFEWEDGYYFLKSDWNTYTTFESNNVLTSNRPWRKEWERFSIIDA